MPDSSIDLIYADPPYDSPASKYKAEPGTLSEGAEFADRFTRADVEAEDEFNYLPESLIALIELAAMTHGDARANYLAIMAPRLIEFQRLLKPTGSLWLHVDDSADYHLRVALDAIFGKKQFLNSIAWCRRGHGAVSGRRFPHGHDTILAYAKQNGNNTYTRQYGAKTASMLAKFKYTDEDGRKYFWWQRKGRVTQKYYADHYYGQRIEDWWSDINDFTIRANAPERTGYPTQKPVALVERIIKAASNEGDLVLDPYMGSGTTAVAAEQQNRRWLGCDLHPVSAQVIKHRLERNFIKPIEVINI